MSICKNILLFFTDQQRADTIAALGNPIIKTPNLDRLVREGTAFTKCYTPSPVCVSARASMVTGLPGHITGSTDNGTSPDQSIPSFMEALQTAGYQTHGTGKMHFTPDSQRLWGFDARDTCEEGMGFEADDDYRRFLTEHGYTHVEDTNGVRGETYYYPQTSQVPPEFTETHWVADRSIDFLNQRDAERPFFLMSSFIKPHPPFYVPTPWNKLYRGPEMAPPFMPEDGESLLTYWNRVQNRYKYNDRGFDEHLRKTMKAYYYACISYVDYQVGRILDALGDEIDNTLILFASDHGECLGDYGCLGKRSMLDVACRVPMLARLPESFPAGEKCDTPVSLLDIFPTATQTAGEKQKPYALSESLQDIAAGKDANRFVISQYHHDNGGIYMIAWRNRKYYFSSPDDKEYYIDLIADPKETRNLANDPAYASQVAEARETLIACLREDGYEKALDGDGWKHWPKRDLPADRDAWLLFQDVPGLQERIDALGPGYARPVEGDGQYDMFICQ